MAKLTLMAGFLYGHYEKKCGISFTSKHNSLGIRFEEDEVPPFLGGKMDTSEIIKLRDFLNRVLEED
jgi:hypothetical protein